MLSKRGETGFWVDNRDSASIPDSLQELLTLWKRHFPVNADFDRMGEVFSAASYQYVLYGMGFETVPGPATRRSPTRENADKLFTENVNMTRKLLSGLPANRELINAIRTSGLRAA